MIKRIAGLILASLLAAGCQQEARGMDSPNIVHTSSSHERDQQVETAAEKKMKNSFSQIKDVVAVEGKGHLLVAYQISHFDRFRSKQIEGKIQKALEKKFSSYEVISSGDLKIFWETQKLAKNEKNLSEKEMKEKILSLKKLKDEQA
ncbi:hypothetical protein [Priestia abyssalis]|uniref:hypothetical protein n=1 Tax=Priestia abyssalis TaxID=1221450 RepID=UPI0009950DBE|nr:hypothetical protein [Priestia abyssalis]